MFKIAVMVSGGGTNLQAIIDAIENGQIKDVKISAVISNNADAFALERAQKAGIPGVCISRKEIPDRDAYNKALLQAVDDADVDLVVLAGFLVVIPQEMIQKYKSLVESIHALPLILSCEEHDYITAAISHLPHVIASSLVNTVHDLDGGEEHMKKIAAGGFKDITRIASSSPEMWENICVHNKDNISKVMDVFIDHLIRARDHMNADDGPYINRMFAASRDYRNSFSDSSYGVLKRVYRIYCDIIDESGAIATIATILAVGGISIKNIQILHNREFEEGVLRIEFYDEESSVKAATLLRQHRYQIWDATGKGTTSQER